MILISKISALARPIDLNYPTNLLIVLITLGTFLVITIFQFALSTPLLTALGTGATTAIAVFLSWALTREIDPAHDWSAFVPLPITLIAALVLGAPALLTLFFLLLSSRVLNQTTGGQATSFDSFLLIILAVFQIHTATIIPLIFLLFVFSFDAILKHNNPKQGKFAVFTLIATVIIVLVYGSSIFTVNFSLYGVLASIILVLAAITFMLTAQEKDSYGDSNQSVISEKRTVIAKIMIALFIVISLLFLGKIAGTMLYPAISSFVGAAIYHLAQRFLNNRL